MRSSYLAMLMLAPGMLSFADELPSSIINEITDKYDLEMKEFQQLAMAYLDEQEARARSKGDKSLLDKCKEHRTSFEQSGDLPVAAPAALKNRPEVALLELEEAFDKAISARIKVNDDMGAEVLERAKREVREKAGIPSIDGTWSEGTAAKGIEVVIVQKANRFTATCTYTHKEHGEVSWRMTGTINKAGELKGRLRHSKAPGSFEDQDRTGKLNREENTITGTATWKQGTHEFIWSREE